MKLAAELPLACNRRDELDRPEGKVLETGQEARLPLVDDLSMDHLRPGE